MSKGRMVLISIKNLILLGIVIAIMAGLFIWYKDYRKGGKKPEEENTVNEVKIENLENYKEKYKTTKLEDLPKEYEAEQAIKDGVVLITNTGEIYNKDNLDDFVIHTTIKRNDERITESIRIGRYTIEGDLILTDVSYNKEDNMYTIRNDSTRDKLGTSTEITEEKASGKLYMTMLSEDDDTYTLAIARTESVYWEPGELEKAKDYIICEYSKNLIVKDTYNSFYGKVLDCNLERMLVEVAKENDETKQVYVYFEENNDMLYQKDTYVNVKYNGVMENNEVKDIVTIRTIEDKFELIFKNTTQTNNQSEDSEQDTTKEANKILSKDETEKYDFDVYTYKGEVSVFIDNEIISLRDALLNEKITVDEIIAKAKSDYENKKIEREAVYKDGGSVEYTYTNYKILKLNRIDEENKDLFIGGLDLDIDKAKEYAKESKKETESKNQITEVNEIINVNESTEVILDEVSNKI